MMISRHMHYFLLIPGPPNPDNLPEDGKLKTETMVKDNRRYYLDLKENQRGRFLRVSFLLHTIVFYIISFLCFFYRY